MINCAVYMLALSIAVMAVIYLVRRARYRNQTERAIKRLTDKAAREICNFYAEKSCGQVIQGMYLDSCFRRLRKAIQKAVEEGK